MTFHGAVTVDKEFDLSEKIVEVDRYGEDFSREAISPKDVKEFIRLLKDTYWYIGDCKTCKSESVPVNHDSDCVNCVIDKLAGDKLI